MTDFPRTAAGFMADFPASGPLAERDEWMPMESAPKDGTAVLLYFPKRYQGTGGVSWGVFVSGEWLDSRAIRDPDASHWRPLPAPPRPSAAFERAMSPDPTKEGVFRDHNCWRCKSGELPCVKGAGNERQCSTLHARND